MSFKEKDFQTLFNKWAKYNYDQSGAFELKLARGKSLPFDALKEHQENALWNSKFDKVIHKIQDCGFQNPFDSFVLHKVPAYVVVMFGLNRKEFIMISIEKWMEEKDYSDRKSITEERAKEIGIICYIGAKHD